MNPDEATGATEPGPEGPGLRLLVLIASLLIAATVSLTFGQVVLRYLFNNPQTWAEEIGRYLFVWITFLGAAVAFRRDTHIRVDAVMTLFGKKVERAGDILRRFVETVAVAGSVEVSARTQPKRSDPYAPVTPLRRVARGR